MLPTRATMLLVALLGVTLTFDLTLAIPEHQRHHGINDPMDHMGGIHPGEEGHEGDASFDHKAVLGSEDDEDAYAQLPPEMAKERLGKLVDMMDTDRDGYVDTAELAHWITNSFKKINAAESAQALKSDDLDKDGYISWDEHMQKTYNVKDMAELEKGNDTDNVKYAKTDKQRFAVADQDKNGKLDEKEMAAFLHPYDYHHMTPNEVERLINEMDTDHDGKISYKEFIQNEQKGEDEEERKNFESHDLNGDKLLDRGELTKWISPGSSDVVEMEVEHLFNVTDVNNDKKLTKAEIVKEHETWVGSEATDYGNHLERDEL